MFRTVVSLGIAGLFLLSMMLTGCGSPNSGMLDDPEYIEVEELQLVNTQDEGPVLQGEFINTSDQPVGIAQLRVAIYDVDNQPVGDALVEVRDVEANGRKDFRSVVEVDGDVQRAQLQGIMLP